MQKKSEEKVNSVFLFGCGIVLILAAVVLIIWYFLNGQTTVTGGFPENESSKMISCESNTIEYPMFTYEGVLQHTLKIDAIFANDKLSSLSLKNTLVYGSENDASVGETWNHSRMNIAFTNLGLSIETLKGSYSVIDNTLATSLYGNASDVTASTRKFLMLEDGVDIDNDAAMIKNYDNQGLKCVEKND